MPFRRNEISHRRSGLGARPIRGASFSDGASPSIRPRTASGHALSMLQGRKRRHRRHAFPTAHPILLTIDAPDGSADLSARVLTLEYEGSSAWRIIVDVYKPGRWERQLKTMVHPRPWVERWPALVTFTGTLPQRPPPSAHVKYRRG